MGKIIASEKKFRIGFGFWAILLLCFLVALFYKPLPKPTPVKAAAVNLPKMSKNPVKK